VNRQQPFGKVPRSFLWGSFLLLALVVVLAAIGMRYRSNGPALQDYLGNMTRKLELLSNMRLNLLQSEEAEKSAVMADTDETSRDFADRSRRAADFVERDRLELEALLQQDHLGKEMELFREFGACWSELRKIDDVILDFAVQNSNIKAAALSFGKGRETMKRFEQSLESLVHRGASSDQCSSIVPLASDALGAGLSILNLHAPHISEARDEKMDAIEAEMRQKEEIIRVSLGKLAEVVHGVDREWLQKANDAYGEFSSVTAEVVRLSRQNTNVKSFELSLGNKRKKAARCDEVLMSLHDAVRSREFKATR
jgi:hypothetical protein